MTAEKFVSKAQYLLYLRLLFAYDFAKKNISKKSLVLDLGSGRGFGASHLSKNGPKVIGLDVEKEKIERALRNYGTENCIFKLYDGTDISFADETFDAVVSLQVIEHIKDDNKAVSEIYRVLKKGGVFILTTPNKNLRLKPNQKPYNEEHQREYNQAELRKLLENKFSNIKLLGIFGSQEVVEIEMERIQDALKITWLDPLNLRSLLPKAIKPKIAQVVEKIINTRKTKYYKSAFANFNLNDYYVSKHNINYCLDFLGICKK